MIFKSVFNKKIDSVHHKKVCTESKVWLYFDRIRYEKLENTNRLIFNVDSLFYIFNKPPVTAVKPEMIIVATNHHAAETAVLRVCSA